MQLLLQPQPPLLMRWLLLRCGGRGGLDGAGSRWAEVGCAWGSRCCWIWLLVLLLCCPGWLLGRR
jgi:hypothetical protein